MYNKTRVLLLLALLTSVYASINSRQRPSYRDVNHTHPSVARIHPYVNTHSLFETSPFWATVICILVVLMIVCTLIGNAMVCLAVFLVRKLKQQPANLLLVSLAAADFCVALFVMPIALVKLIHGDWLLGGSRVHHSNLKSVLAVSVVVKLQAEMSVY